MDCNKDYRYSDGSTGSQVWDDMVSGKVYDAAHPYILERLNVVKDIPDGCVAVGNPCRVVKYLNKE